MDAARLMLCGRWPAVCDEALSRSTLKVIVSVGLWAPVGANLFAKLSLIRECSRIKHHNLRPRLHKLISPVKSMIDGLFDVSGFSREAQFVDRSASTARQVQI